MMQAMRDQVKIIYWVVIITFVLFTFLVWGIGYLRDTGGPQQVAGTVATVNGTEVDEVAWRERTNAILSQMRARQGNDQPITENEVVRAREQAYEELVNMTLQKMEAQRMGLSVTQEEIVDMLANDPPAYLLAQFTDAEGNVDHNAYYEALQNPNIPWNQVEDQLRETIPLQKLEQRVAGRAVVGEAELRQAFIEQNQRAVAEYVGVRFSDIELEDETVTDDQAKAWYDAHLDEYKQPERATVRYVQIPKAASETDEQEVLSILEEIRQDIVEGRSSFEEAARTYSEDTSASLGGDLGFFDRNRMVEPFTEAAFDLAVGDVSPPVKTQFGYHLIECTDERLDESGERTEMRARHVLLKLHPSQATLDELREEAYATQERAEAAGLDVAAEERGHEVNTSNAFQEGFNVPGVPNSLPGSRFAFGNDVGSLSPVFETEEALYMVEVAERIPAGHRTLEEVRSMVDAAVLNDRRAELASTRLRAVLADAGADASLEEIGKNDGVSYAVTDTFVMRQNIPDIGFNTAFARTALSVPQGTLVKEVRTNQGVYALRTLHRSEFDEEAFRLARPQLTSSLLFSRQRQIFQRWMEKLREEAEIQDRRAELL